MQDFILSHQWIIWSVIIWNIPWKGVALWKAARNGHKFWFGTLFIFNTLAILEIVYIFFVSKGKNELTLPKNFVNGNGEKNFRNGNRMIKGL